MPTFIRGLVLAACAIGVAASAYPQEVDTATQLRALITAETSAKLQLRQEQPAGTVLVAMNDKLLVRGRNGDLVPATASQQAAFDAAARATEARAQFEQAHGPAIRDAELAVVRQVIAEKTPPGAEIVQGLNGLRVKLASGEVVFPEDDLWLALQRRDELLRNIDTPPPGIMPAVQGAEDTQIRIVAEPTLAGRTGEFSWRNLALTQAMVFNRAAVLTEALHADHDRNVDYVIPAGTKLFVVDGPGGESDPAYCLPHEGVFGFFTGLSAWIPCYFDRDGDGALETQTNGGAPTPHGVFMHASGFPRVGEVRTPARFKSIPYLEGYQQRIGIELAQYSHNKASDTHVVHFDLMTGPTDKRMQAVFGSRKVVTVKGGETAVVNFYGANIELRAPGGSKVVYKIIDPMPEQPFGFRTVLISRYY